MTSKQWLVFDELAWLYGNNTLRITTRQSIQFHGVVKANLRLLVKKINESLLSTLAACGDVNRNVLAPPTPAYTKAREQVFQDCVRVADALRPQTRAYYAIWIDGFQLKIDDPVNQAYVDPLIVLAPFGRDFTPAGMHVACRMQKFRSHNKHASSPRRDRLGSICVHPGNLDKVLDDVTNRKISTGWRPCSTNLSASNQIVAY